MALPALENDATLRISQSSVSATRRLRDRPDSPRSRAAFPAFPPHISHALFSIRGCAFECSIARASLCRSTSNVTPGTVARSSSSSPSRSSPTRSSPASSTRCGFCFRLCVVPSRSHRQSSATREPIASVSSRVRVARRARAPRRSHHSARRSPARVPSRTDSRKPASTRRSRESPAVARARGAII